MAKAQVEKLVSIPELAREAGRSRATVWRRLRRMHAEDVAAGGGEWLIRVGEPPAAGSPDRRPFAVNKSALLRAHPELARRADPDDLATDVEAHEAELHDVQERVHELERQLDAIRDRHSELVRGQTLLIEAVTQILASLPPTKRAPLKKVLAEAAVAEGRLRPVASGCAE